MNPHFKTVKLEVDSSSQKEQEGNKVDEAKSGSVTVSIYKSRNSRKVRKQEHRAAQQLAGLNAVADLLHDDPQLDLD